MKEQLSEILKQLQEDKPAAGDSAAARLDALVGRLERLLVLMLVAEIAKLSGAADSPQEPEADEENAEGGLKTDQIDSLRDVATTRQDQETKRTEYLLHRALDDGERDPAEAGAMTTEQETTWIPCIEAAESLQTKSNPVVSCWIPEENIVDLPVLVENTGTWGDMGQNPAKPRFRVKVKAGTFQIHQELKQ